jgi:hypothetical protein
VAGFYIPVCKSASTGCEIYFSNFEASIDPCFDMWKCMTCNLLKFKLQIIYNKFLKGRMAYVAYCTEHSESMTNYTL